MSSIPAPVPSEGYIPVENAGLYYRAIGKGQPLLVIHGEDDLIPAEFAVHTAHVIPGSRFVQLKGCGHFSYMECPDEVHSEIIDFFRGSAKV